MTKRMLIDGIHPEEIRVVITDGNRLDEYDIETSTKSQLKGNIYLAKVTRVEPSLQAAFVDYGGGRHGFLAFSEIHPDYYQIPIEDREALKQDLALLEGNAQAAQAHVAAIDGEVTDTDEQFSENAVVGNEDDPIEQGSTAKEATDEKSEVDVEKDLTTNHAADRTNEKEEYITAAGLDLPLGSETKDGDNEPASSAAGQNNEEHRENQGAATNLDIEQNGTNDSNSSKETEKQDNPFRRYKIQEVIKRRQILLVQVVKEERGNKGAALTTYMSLAGRYCVLMPNATRSGGGVSRKITGTADRRRLRELLKNLEVPEGMGVIMRTAGMKRNKLEIKRDFDYLMRLWEDVRSLTLESAAPALVYEEGDLIKRAIRDLYSRDIEEVAVEGTKAYQAAKKLMRLMMPSHAKRVQPYRDTIPLFHRYQVETQLESMHNPLVQLKSGGYIVIDTTEALVAIDVNSGRSTKERNIEETAVKTNLEAATEISRQLRLRDLAGLIVIDFIDMEANRNQRAVEKRLKEAVKTDRARIQLGRISTFGLFELSRQRLRPSIIETSTEACPHCHGSGFVRSTESMTLHALRMIEEEGIRMRSSDVTIFVPTSIALYILNQKRDALIEIENRYGLNVGVLGDDTVVPPDIRIERIKAKTSARIQQDMSGETIVDEDIEADRAEEPKGKDSGRKKRPKRRRKKETSATGSTTNTLNVDNKKETIEESEAGVIVTPANDTTSKNSSEETNRPTKRRRRGRRGGRRRSQKVPQQDSDGTTDNGQSDSVDRVSEFSKEATEIASKDNSSPQNNTTPPQPAAATGTPGESPSTPPSINQPRRGWWQRIIE